MSSDFFATPLPAPRPGGRIPVAGPWVTEHEVNAVAKAAAESWYGNAGRYTQRFEEAFARYVERQFALALPSCTSALHLSLAGLGIGTGDEVIVPDATWIATSAPVDYMGATPVFADIDPVTWCISAQAVEELVTDATRAVIVVDLYGGMPDMQAILDVARRHGLHVIEDAAEAIGSALRGQPAGSFGVSSAFSFHGSKTLTTGEGGMVVTDDRALLDRMAVLRDHGRRPGDVEFKNAEVAFKYRMSDLQAAFGSAQLERIDELVARKRQIFQWYQERLLDLPGVTLNAEPDGVANSYWMVTVILDAQLSLPKEEVCAHLRENGIDARPFFHPLSSLPAYGERPQARSARARNAVSYRICPFGLNLPSALSLSEADVDLVSETVSAIVRDRSGSP